jgi:hypothetical protein
MSRRYDVVHLALCLGLSAGCSAHGMNVDDVLRRHVEALGGAERVAAVRALRMIGTYEEGALRAETFMERARPDYRVVGIPSAGVYEGYDGRAWEYHRVADTIIRSTGAAEAAVRRGAEFDESIVRPSAKGHHVTFGGRVTIDGHDAVALEVTLADGWAKTYYLDPDSYLILALRKAMPIHARGEDVETLTWYEEYRPEGGVLFPHRFVERRVADGAVLNTLHWSSIVVNPRLDARRFTAEYWRAMR